MQSLKPSCVICAPKKYTWNTGLITFEIVVNNVLSLLNEYIKIV